MLRIFFSLLYMKYIFFGFYGSVGFEANIETLKKVLRQPWNALMLQLSLSKRWTVTGDIKHTVKQGITLAMKCAEVRNVTNKIVLTWKFISPEK